MKVKSFLVLTLLSVGLNVWAESSKPNLKSFTGGLRVEVDAKPVLKSYIMHFYGADNKECVVKDFSGDVINFPNNVSCAATVPAVSKVWFEPKTDMIVPAFDILVTGDQSEGKGVACNVTVKAKTVDKTAKIVEVINPAGGCSVVFK